MEIFSIDLIFKHNPLFKNVCFILSGLTILMSIPLINKISEETIMIIDLILEKWQRNLI